MKRLHDVAVRMRPRVPRAPDGAPIVPAEDDAVRPERSVRADVAGQAAPQDSGFSKRGDAPPIPARAPFMPSSRDLARPGTAAAEDTTPRDPSRTARPSADMTKPDDRGDRPVSVPRRQIWDLEPDEVEAVASHAVVTDRTYLPDLPEGAGRDESATRGPARTTADRIAEQIADDARDETEEDMAGRALRALQAAERQLEARGIPASALYEGEAAKTRVLGFHGTGLETDAISAVARKSAGEVRFPAGWIVVVDGPGRGAYFAVTNSVSSIGRGLDQAICLNFGDASISRNNHAAIAYDAEQNRFFLGHGNKSNIVRRNGMPVLATEELIDGDEIRIGKTTLRFVALCGPRFTWGPEPQEEADDA